MPNAAGIADLRRENALLAERLEALAADHAALQKTVSALRETAASLKDQVDWFKRQLFGRRSEKRIEFDLAEQASLFESLGAEDVPAPEVPVEEISYRRRRRKDRAGAVNESGLRFDDTVPVTTIEVKDPVVESIPESERVVVGEKVTHRLAQRPASYEVLRYVRPVVKRRDTGELAAARAPANVLERTAADVSLLAGMLVDKFRHHLPLHRQYRRMADAGIAVSRASLTNWTGRAIDLLEPVAAAQTAHVLEIRVLAMDETPVKAGRAEPGRMRQGYFWPIYGDDDEVVFPLAPTREHRHVEAFLGDFEGVLSSDGYEAYARYAAKRAGVRHAQCWSHARRGFEQAWDGEPEATDAALALIGALSVPDQYSPEVPPPALHLHVDAFQQRQQRRPVQRPLAAPGIRRREPPRLQALRPHPVAAAVERAPHVRRRDAKPDAPLRCRDQHRGRRTRSTTPAPRSSSASQEGAWHRYPLEFR